MNYKMPITREFPDTRPVYGNRICDGQMIPDTDDEVGWYLVENFKWLDLQRAVEYRKQVRYICYKDKRNGEPVCETCKELRKFKNLIDEDYTYATEEELADEWDVISTIKSFGYKEIDRNAPYAKYKR